MPRMKDVRETIKEFVEKGTVAFLPNSQGCDSIGPPSVRVKTVDLKELVKGEALERVVANVSVTVDFQLTLDMNQYPWTREQ